MVKKDNTAWAFIGVLIILGALAVAFFFWQQTKKREVEMAEMVEMMTYEKEQLENEYNDLSLEMEGFSYKTNNDSILKLSCYQQRIKPFKSLRKALLLTILIWEDVLQIFI